jgi:oligopeptide/dipeptide ABC transporter ATP-binding protein
VDDPTASLPMYLEEASGPVARQKVELRREGGPVLSVQNLSVTFPTDDGPLTAVDDVSYDLYPNEVLGIVGESGSGKSVSSMAILGLLPKTAKISGKIMFGDVDVLTLAEKEAVRLRGSRIAMIFQDALASLNPVFTVGSQITEAIEAHQPDLKKAEVKRRAVELLDIVGIPTPMARYDQYPHEYSGGMRQRAMIAMAIANDPDVLIADEPTTALDVTIQAQVMDVLERVQRRVNTAIILITHDLGVVAGVADRVVVMYAGRLVEMGDVEDIFYQSRHPYTRGLLASLPRLDVDSTTGRLHRIRGQPPSLVFRPPGCAFHPRCDDAEVPGRCNTEVPTQHAISARHWSLCHFAESLPVPEVPDRYAPEAT